MAAFERDATDAMKLAAEAAAHGIPAGMPVQRVVLAVHESLEDQHTADADAENGSSSSVANGVQVGQAAAAAAVGSAARDPRSQQQQQQPGVDDEFLEVYGEAPGSPSEAILAALAAEVDEDGQEQQQQNGGSSSSSKALKQYPRYKNLFGPDTVVGYLLDGYISLHGLCQLPFSAAANRLAAEQKGSSVKQRDAVGQGLLLQLQKKGLQLQLAPDILADQDYQTDFVEEYLSDDRIGTWKQLLQPLDQAKEADRAAAAAAAGSSDQHEQQQQQGGSAEHWEDGEAAGGRSGSYNSPLGLLVCPAAPKREDRADYNAYNNAATVLGGSAGDWGGAAAAAVGFSFSQPVGQGLGVTPAAAGFGGQLGLGSAGVDASMLAMQRQRQMVQAAIEAAKGIGLGAAKPGQQQQQGWQNSAAGTAATAATAAPAWASQLAEMMQQQQEEEALPPLPPEPAPSETAAAAAAGSGSEQQQQQQAPRRFVVPGALDDDDDDEDDLHPGRQTPI